MRKLLAHSLALFIAIATSLVAASVAAALMLGGCETPPPITTDAGAPVCSDLGCEFALCNAAGLCRCTPPGADASVFCVQPLDGGSP